MAIKEILLLGNPILRKKCEKVKNFSDPILLQNINDLKDTLQNFRTTHGFGRGIAAPQIGITKELIYINIDNPLVLINLKIIKRSKAMMMLWDDCFSFLDIMVRVKRNVQIRAAYQDEFGKTHTMDAKGGFSELLQHEIDHINGVLAIDRAIDLKHIVLRSEWKKISSAAHVGYQL